MPRKKKVKKVVNTDEFKLERLKVRFRSTKPLIDNASKEYYKAELLISNSMKVMLDTKCDKISISERHWSLVPFDVKDLQIRLWSRSHVAPHNYSLKINRRG